MRHIRFGSPSLPHEWWRSITVQVWALVVLCALLVSGLIGLSMRADIERERADVLKDLSHRATTEAEGLEETLKAEGQVLDALTGLAESPEVVAAGAGCRVALGQLQRLVEDYGYVAVVDRAGTIRCASGKFAAHVGRPSFAGRLEVLAALAANKPVVSAPFRDPLLRELALMTAVPASSRLSIVIVFTTKAALAPFEPPRDLVIDVVDARTGLVLMRHPETRIGVGQPASSFGLDAVLRAEGALTSVPDEDGRRLYTAKQVPDSDVWVAVGESEAQAYAPAQASLRRNGLFGAAIVFVVALTGVLLQRGVARPARRLRRAIRQLADDPDAPPAPTDGPLELAAVARAFNEASQERRRADVLTRALVEHATDLLMVVDVSGGLTYVAPAAERLLGAQVGDSPLKLARLVHLADREALLRAVSEWLKHGGPELRTELRVRDLDGQVHHLDVHAQDLRHDPDVGGLVIAARDDTDRKRAEEDLAFRARHDALTGLANRARILDELRVRLVETVEPVALLFVDLDRFKLINDSHGHAVGDQVLVALADRLFRLTAGRDVVGRLGGDEFVLVAPSASTAEEAMALADRVRAVLNGPVTVGQRELFISGSIGVAFGEPGDSAANVLRNADTAMYRAKELGRNRAALFDDEMRREARRLLRTEADLHRALEREELVVHYQPVVELEHHAVIGVEALVRWRHPTRGLVPPCDFIPVAEETGLIVPLGRFVLEQSCAFAAVEEAVGVVSVNVSPRQIMQSDFVPMVRGVLHATGLPPARLCLEVTEAVLVQDGEVAAEALDALRSDGVRVAIDDFGTGWASLTYLQQLPVDTIKLDRSFVSQVPNETGASAIVSSLIHLAHSLGLTVTAEGVETRAQAEFLRGHTCDTGQGYLFSRPVPGQDLVAALAARGTSQVPQPRAGLSA